VLVAIDVTEDDPLVESDEGLAIVVVAAEAVMETLQKNEGPLR
jgi:hypothetical protein